MTNTGGAQPGRVGRTMRSIAVLIVLLGLTAGCTTPVAAGLEEGDANRVVVALESAGVVADKIVDPTAEGRWQVTVAKDDAAAALVVLNQENLPPRPSPGVLDTLEGGTIVPSRTAEHAKLVAGTAGDLERSLRGIQGVLGARVHLALPEQDPLATENEPRKPTGSVLLQYRGATAPISEADVQRLVAGAVPGLDTEAVAVVLTPTAVPTPLPERELARFGPITATRSSLFWARAIVAGVVGLAVVLMAVILVLWARLRRTTTDLADAREAGALDSAGPPSRVPGAS